MGENRFGFAAVGDESGTCASQTTTTTMTPEISSTTASVNSTNPTVTYPGKCRGVNRLYVGGDIISMTKVKKAKFCEKKCNDNPKCTHWTWYKRRFHENNLRKKCALMSGGITQIIKSKRVVSGAVGQ